MLSVLLPSIFFSIGTYLISKLLILISLMLIRLLHTIVFDTIFPFMFFQFLCYLPVQFWFIPFLSCSARKRSLLEWRFYLFSSKILSLIVPGIFFSSNVLWFSIYFDTLLLSQSAVVLSTWAYLFWVLDYLLTFCIIIRNMIDYEYICYQLWHFTENLCWIVCGNFLYVIRVPKFICLL